MSESNQMTPRAIRRRVRVIPVLLIDGRGRLIKTVNFGKRTYIGDPINAVKIFNTKEVDELLLLDIDASKDRRHPNYALVEDIVGEAFMPIGYGGGIRNMEHVARLYTCGIEKVVLSTALADNGSLIQETAARFGSQAVAVCLPTKRSMFGGTSVQVRSGTRKLPLSPEEIAVAAAKNGAGEILVYDIDRDGTYQGYDLPLLRRLASSLDVPVVAAGGARDLDDFRAAVDAGCSAVAAGSMFVYHSRTRGVLISYPSEADLALKVHRFAK